MQQMLEPFLLAIYLAAVAGQSLAKRRVRRLDIGNIIAQAAANRTIWFAAAGIVVDMAVIVRRCLYILRGLAL